MQWLEGIADREAWPARSRFALTLGMDEALTNVLSHAFGTAPSAPESPAPSSSSPPSPSPAGAPAVVLAYRRHGDELCVEIADNGRAYDPTAWAPAPLARTLDEATPGGQGVRLMRHYLKDLRYRRDDGWNRLTLVADHG
ncbi:Serine/threonine-protein kinase BtrW [Bordetella sputigena]